MISVVNITSKYTDVMKESEKERRGKATGRFSYHPPKTWKFIDDKKRKRDCKELRKSLLPIIETPTFIKFCQLEFPPRAHNKVDSINY